MGAIEKISNVSEMATMGGLAASSNLAVPSPVVTRERFAEMIGVPAGVVLGWANKGLLPQVKIGRYALVNLELLKKQCLDREFV